MPGWGYLYDGSIQKAPPSQTHCVALGVFRVGVDGWTSWEAAGLGVCTQYTVLGVLRVGMFGKLLGLIGVIRVRLSLAYGLRLRVRMLLLTGEGVLEVAGVALRRCLWLARCRKSSRARSLRSTGSGPRA